MVAVAQVVGGDFGEGLHVDSVCCVDDVVESSPVGSHHIGEKLLEQGLDIVAHEIDCIAFNLSICDRCFDRLDGGGYPSWVGRGY